MPSLSKVGSEMLDGALPALDASSLTSIPAANITGTLPAISGASLTNLDARDLENALPAISGASLTGVGLSVATTGGQYDASTTGTITVSGLSFAPQALWCLYNVGSSNDASWGYAAVTANAHGVLLDYSDEGSSWHSVGGYFARASYGSGKFSNLAVSSWDSGGVTITKTKNNAAPSSTVVYKILLIG